MKLLRKFSLKYLLIRTLTASLLFTVTWKTAARDASTIEFCTALTTWQDTTRPLLKKDTLIRVNPTGDTIPTNIIDTTNTITTIDTFNLKISKDTLDGPVHYEAEDSAVVLIDARKVILYGKTMTKYKDIQLKAPKVEMDQETNILTAVNSIDSLGTVIDRAHFEQGENTFDSDTIRFNFKSQQGLTKNTYTQQGEMFVKGEDIKKIDANTFYVRHGRFTTCNLDDPHFAFQANKLKVINNKLAVSGPARPEFEGVPVPIYLPFGFYPLSRGRHSGFLPPQFTANESFGLGLEGLGYYKVLNEYFDITFRSNIYSYGGWSTNITPTYRKRYRYQGTLNFSIQSTKYNFKGDPDFLKNRSYFLTWNHSVDTRARPGTSFSASVNAGSSKYNELVPNDPNRNFRNQLSSSIVYSKTWRDKPYNLTISANHSQNTQLRLINLNIPDVGFTVSTIYPLEAKEFVGTPKWYEKLGIAYSGSFRNQVSFYDTAFRFKNLIDTLQWGAQHRVPITLSLPPLGPLQVAPSISYDETWIAQKFRRTWNPTLKKVDTSITKGFYTDRQMQYGIGLSTAVFGTFNFKKSRIIAIRHTIRPSISANYRPDLSKNHFYRVQVDSLGNSFRFSEFEGSLYGFYPEGRYGGMGISVDNNLEMKWRSKKDTGEAAIKKIRLIDGYGFNTGYNFIADSFRLQPVQFYLRSTLFEKINITAGATLNPYLLDSRGFPVNRYAWQGDKFSLGTISTGNIAISTQFQSKPRDPKIEEERKQNEQRQLDDPALMGDQQRLLDYMRQNPAEFVDFNVPWTLGLSFSLYFNKRMKPDYSGFETEFSSNLNFNGSFSLTPKWNFSLNGYFDFDTRKLQTFSMSINREMHCWQMSIGVTPVGLYRFFNISISPKASMLQDLKINRTRTFTNY